MDIFHINTPSTLAYQQYQRIRDILPQKNVKKAQEKVEKLLDIADLFDTFFFDAYGVLNTADGLIPSAINTVAQLKNQGKKCLVISNAAGFQREFYLRRYSKLGFDFSPDEVVVSRDVAMRNLQLAFERNPETIYGVISADKYQDDINALLPREKMLFPEDRDFADKAQVFLFLGAMNWNEAKQSSWCAALKENPREIWVGNPDLIAPKGLEASIEAGTYTLLLEPHLYTKLFVCGKPFPTIYEIAAERLDNFNPERTLMIGDTLHTDILGGNSFGIKTALAVNYGFFKGLDYNNAILDSQIEADFILETV